MTQPLAAQPLAKIIPLKRAVIYLRVSTTKQAETSEDREGYSLPAQREACYRKAEQLGAAVVATYLDRGESARTDQRPQFQAMLERIRAERDVDYVICDKLDRFAATAAMTPTCCLSCAWRGQSWSRARRTSTLRRPANSSTPSWPASPSSTAATSPPRR